MSTMRWKEVGNVMVAVHSRRQPEEGEWRDFIDACTKMGPRMVNCLVIADVGLTAAQRRMSAGVVKASGTKAVAVVCTSLIARNVITALGWMTGVYKGFHPSELDSAIAFLHFEDTSRAKLLESVRQFARELGVEDLAGIAPADSRARNE